MLFHRTQWAGIEDGSITVAFRRWKRPTVKTGGSLRSPVGVLSIDAVDPVDESEITDRDVAASGHPSLDALLDSLGASEDGRTLYRIRFRRSGEDPRIALRNRDELTPEEQRSVLARLERFDAAADRPWTGAVLRLVADGPGRPARELAERFGLPRPEFKQRVRKLKELGLTESLEVGYRLSPRGRTVLGLVDGRGS